MKYFFLLSENIFLSCKNAVSASSLSGSSPTFIGHIERGLKSPTVKTLQKISAALDISLAELFTPIQLNGHHPSEIRSVDMERLLHSLNELNDEELSMLTQIVLGIIRFKKRQ